MEATDRMDSALKSDNLVTNTLFDEDTSGMLLDDALFIRDDAAFNLFDFAWLDGTRRLASELLQLGLRRLDTALKLWDIVAGVSITSVEHVSHRHHRISDGLEILEGILIPRFPFVFE